LDVLFESELQGLAPGGTLSARVASASPPMSEYAISLVEGVVAHRERIDELLSTYAVGWTLDRMPVIDRNLLRIGTYEILYRDDVPDIVAISEAVSLARELSTDESPAFVNGLLARIVELKPTLAR
jgi:N utilization substance protein B